MKELAVNCTLYFDMIHPDESADDALDRLLNVLGDNDIAANVYKFEVSEED